MEKKTILEYFKDVNVGEASGGVTRSKVVLWSKLVKAQDYPMLKVDSAKFAKIVVWRRRGSTGMSTSAKNAVCAIVLRAAKLPKFSIAQSSTIMQRMISMDGSAVGSRKPFLRPLPRSI